MSEKIFNEELKEKLSSLNHKQIVFFTWLCSVRVLPLLGVDRSLFHWKEKERQKHTYDILKALDIVYAYTTGDSYEFEHEDIYNSLCATFEFDTTKIVAKPVAVAIKVVFADTTASYVDEIIACLIKTCDIAKSHNIDLIKIFHDDIECIKSGILGKLNNSTEIYGVCWDNLRYCFSDMNCNYWIDLYIDVFKNGFQLDKKALEQRLNVPKEIQKQGSKAVADFIIK
jgi:hypothetical protein